MSTAAEKVDMSQWFRHWSQNIERHGNYERGVMLGECGRCGAPITDLAIREGVAGEPIYGRPGRCARCVLSVMRQHSEREQQ